MPVSGTDGSFWWGSDSQWRTEIRRDYITSSGHVYDYDAFSSFRRRNRLLTSDDNADQPLTADQESFIKNRCQPTHPDYGIDERRR